MNCLKTICFALAVLSGILLFSGQAHAVSYALTGFTYDTGAGMVYGTSQTYLDYDLDPYYNAGVDGYLIKYNDPTLSSYTVLSSGSQNHQYDAVVLTASAVQRGETYAVFSDHFLQTTLYYYGYPYDPYGISYNYFGDGGGSPYYGFQYWQAVIMQDVWFYLGRTGVIVSLPDITQLAPDAGLPGTTPVVQILGKYIGEHTQIPPVVSVSGYGVTAQFGNFLPNGVEVYLQIADDADIGDHTLSLTSDGVLSNSVNFRVGDRSPQITGITPPQGNTGDQVNVTITGTNFGVNPQVQIDGSGVNPTITSATSTEIQAVFSIADLTYPGNRNITIKSNGRTGGGFTPGAGNSDTSNGVAFQVTEIIVGIPDNIPVIEKYGEQTIDVTIRGLIDNQVKFTLQPNTGTTGAAQFDNNSNEIIRDNGDYTLKIRGITESSVINNMSIKATLVNGTNTLNQKQFTVAVISSLEFERINSDDILLDNNPGTNGTHTAEEGLRIFPDKKDPADATDRSILRVKATVLPNDPSLTVYFASFDLDDPSTSSVIDANSNNGNDNNGAVNGSKSGELLNPTSGSCTNAAIASDISRIQCAVSSGGASANYKVTMQPGDNFAIAASLVGNYRNQIVVNTSAGENLINSGNQIIPVSGGANPNNIQGIRSNMLTVWRKLNIEIDSMSSARENYVRGNVSGNKTINSGSSATINVSAPDLIVNRFKDGRLVLASIDNFLSVVSNTSNSVTVTNTTANNIVITNNVDFEIASQTGTNTALGTIPSGQTILPSQTVTLAISSRELVVNAFSNGQLYITPNLYSLSVTENTNSTVKVTNDGASAITIADATHFRLYDDDDMNDDGVKDGDENDEVSEPDISLLTTDSDSPANNVFAPAYIHPKCCLSGSHSKAPFLESPSYADLNNLLNSTSFLNLSHEAREDFWTIYLLGAYQPPRLESIMIGGVPTDVVRDGDPLYYFPSGLIATIYGAANSGSSENPIVRRNLGQGAVIFDEVGRPAEYPTGYAAKPISRAYTTAHEVGHLFQGVHADKGLMDSTATRTSGSFSDTSIFFIRQTAHP